MDAERHEEDVRWRTVPPREAHWIIRHFFSSRYFAAFAVLGTFLAAVTLQVYGTLVIIQLIWSTIAEYRISVDGVKHLQVVFIEMTDMFLLGTVLFIVAFGLYQLFIQPDLPLPSWLKIHNLDQLTQRLMEVVGVLLSVTFLAFAVEGIPDASPVEFGASVAVVIAALSLLLVVTTGTQRSAVRRRASDRIRARFKHNCRYCQTPDPSVRNAPTRRTARGAAATSTAPTTVGSFRSAA